MDIGGPPGLVPSTQPMAAASAPVVAADDGWDRAIWLPSSFVQELVESAVLVHFDVIQAHSALGGDTVGLQPKNGRGGWQAVADVLAGLAYDPSARDPWHRLGITPFAGQRPSEALIEQRLHVAATFLSATNTGSWPAADRERSATALRALDAARSACVELLPAVLRSRARDPKFACPRWAELGIGALMMAFNSAETEDEQIATQLSAVLGGEFRHVPPDGSFVLMRLARWSAAWLWSRALLWRACPRVVL